MKENSAASPSSNWLALKKTLSHSYSTTDPRSSKKEKATSHTKKRKRSASITTDDGAISHVHEQRHAAFPRGDGGAGPVAGPSMRGMVVGTHTETIAGGRDTKESLRQMILGQTKISESQLQPGRYLALDCEMVGVGIDGAESSLARVSLVNYHGAVMLDAFVRQRERVVDYRTFVSGVRDSDMVNAKPFAEVQKHVAELLIDRVLVGHAVFNDLKALLLSHPRPLTRDTQQCAGKAKLLKTKYPALRKLIQQEFGIDIQGGEHSSVTDARATMALYRLHRKEWDKNWHPSQLQAIIKTAEVKSLKRKRNSDDVEDDTPNDRKPVSSEKCKEKDATKESHTVGGRKGISSGLSTVVKRAGSKGIERVVKGHDRPTTTTKTRGGPKAVSKSKDKWWATLGVGKSFGSKGSVSISRN